MVYSPTKENNKLKNKRINLENRIKSEKQRRNQYNKDNNYLKHQIRFLNKDYAARINALKITNKNLNSENDRLITDNANYNVIKSNNDRLINMYELTEQNFNDEDKAAYLKKIINLGDKYTYLVDQNNNLSKRYDNIKNQFTRHDNKNNFYSQKKNILNIFYTILFYLYYLLFFITIYILYFNKPDWKIYYKMFLILLFLIFPFVIYSIEIFLYNSWIYIYSIISGNVYNNLSYSNKVVLNNTTDLTTKE
jgi:hypothetical protein